LFHNKPYGTAKRKNIGTGRTRLTALTAALTNGKMKTKVVTTSTRSKQTISTQHADLHAYTPCFKKKHPLILLAIS